MRERDEAHEADMREMAYSQLLADCEGEDEIETEDFWDEDESYWEDAR